MTKLLARTTSALRDWFLLLPLTVQMVLTVAPVVLVGLVGVALLIIFLGS